MATRNHLGKSIYYSATLPATNDAAGFEALTWAEIEFMVTGPQLGYTHNMIPIDQLKEGVIIDVKGMGTGQTSELSFRIDNSALTTNQAAVKALADAAGGDIALKIGSGTGTAGALVAGDTVVYAFGIVHSYRENAADGTSYEGFMVTFKQNDLTVLATEPV